MIVEQSNKVEILAQSDTARWYENSFLKRKLLAYSFDSNLEQLLDGRSVKFPQSSVVDRQCFARIIDLTLVDRIDIQFMLFAFLLPRFMRTLPCSNNHRFNTNIDRKEVETSVWIAVHRLTDAD